MLCYCYNNCRSKRKREYANDEAERNAKRQKTNEMVLVMVEKEPPLPDLVKRYVQTRLCYHMETCHTSFKPAVNKRVEDVPFLSMIPDEVWLIFLNNHGRYLVACIRIECESCAH